MGEKNIGEIMAKIPQEVQQNPKWINSKQTAPGFIKVKLLKMKIQKDKFERRTYYITKNNVLKVADFSTEKWRPGERTRCWERLRSLKLALGGPSASRASPGISYTQGPGAGAGQKEGGVCPFHGSRDRWVSFPGLEGGVTRKSRDARTCGRCGPGQGQVCPLNCTGGISQAKDV